MDPLVFDPPIHPGEFLADLLGEMNITQADLARALKVHHGRINEIVRCQRGISADTTARLARYFETSVEYWQNLQAGYERDCVMVAHRAEINAIRPLSAAE